MTTNDYYMEKFGKIPNPKKQSELTWFQISKMLTNYHEQQLKILNMPVVGNSEAAVCDNCKCHPTVLYLTSTGRFCEACMPITN